MEFEWDPDKSEANLKKDGISFREASTVFGDPLALTFNDPDHSIGEHRFLTFGHSGMNQLRAVVHTERHRKTRIISARRATKQERKIYEDG
ncbi:MAG: BrnT family toxin [Candidatus Edwardsbacteria bacterium]